jgi:hypothetical protein
MEALYYNKLPGDQGRTLRLKGEENPQASIFDKVASKVDLVLSSIGKRS